MKKISKKQQENLIAEENRLRQDAAVISAHHRSRSSISAAVSITRLFKNETPDLTVLAERLARQQNNFIENNDNGFVEATLMGQAQTLQALFNYMTECISSCEAVAQVQAYAEMAMGFNNSCRKTLLTLSQIKNPAAPVFLRQNNTATNMQINQSGAKKQRLSKKIMANELLSNEDIKNAKVDSRRMPATIPVDTEMATLEVGRCKNPSRKKHKQNECL